MKNQRFRGSFIALAAVGVTVAVATVTMIITAASVRSSFQDDYVVSKDPLKQELRQRYGPGKNSQFDEEWIIRDYFQDRRNGTFVDVGASHYKEWSNTYYLETALGWSGIAVDALHEFTDGYKAHRPRTRFVAMFASDVADRTVQFFVSDVHQVSSSDPNFTKRWGDAKARQVPTTTLNTVLDQAGIQKVDFVSMDIELSEPKALAGFDIRRFQPALVCIEGHPEVRQQILDYFAKHRYGLVGKYLRVDPVNLYFQPFAE